VLEVAHLSKSYAGKPAVTDLSFSVAAGEVLGLVGPNGAGKTSTLRCLAGILPPTSGTIRIAGHDIAADPVAAKGALAWVPDEPRFFEYLSVGDHLRWIGRLYGVADVEERIPVLLGEMELGDKGNLLPGALSRGMKQKLSLAMALVHDPRVLLFDEPLTGLDPVAIRRAKDTIVARARAGAAVVVSSHLLDLVQEIAGRVLVLMDGRAAALGTLAELQAAHPDLAAGARLEEIFLRMAAASRAGGGGGGESGGAPPAP
jgi:ABC-2 type transport system ATP-binding protein